jgi:hypothetical protein
MACPTRRSPAARCSPPRRRAAPSAARCRSLLVIVLKPSWSLYRGRARGRERVRPNERAISKHTTTRGSAASPRSADLLAVPEWTPNERGTRRTSRHPPPPRDQRPQLGRVWRADARRPAAPVGRGALCGSVIRQVGAISARPGSTAAPPRRRPTPSKDAQRFRAVMAPGCGVGSAGHRAQPEQGCAGRVRLRGCPGESAARVGGPLKTTRRPRGGPLGAANHGA